MFLYNYDNYANYLSCSTLSSYLSLFPPVLVVCAFAIAFTNYLSFL
jgi:hypothetical protein